MISRAPAARRLFPPAISRSLMTRVASVLLVAVAFTSPVARAEEPAGSFKAKVKPLIEAHCVDCHGPDVQQAKLRLDNLSPDLRDERTAATWALVHDKLVSGAMPPKKRERPEKAELHGATT